MTDDENDLRLRHIEVDHTKLDISFYEEGEQLPMAPTFAMTVDNLTGQAVRCWLEWPVHLSVGATSFGALVRGAREALHVPLDEVARQIVRPNRKTLSVGYLKALERGNRFPSYDLVPQFARVLRISEDVLYFSIGASLPTFASKCSRLSALCGLFRHSGPSWRQRTIPATRQMCPPPEILERRGRLWRNL